MYRNLDKLNAILLSQDLDRFHFQHHGYGTADKIAFNVNIFV